MRQKGCCAISGKKFMVGDKKHLDHKVPLADGGLHAEGNLRWVLASEHQAKTSEEASVRAWVMRAATKHAGLERTGKVKIRRRPKAEKAPLRVAAGKSEIARRYR